jgi:uncharacterized protein
MKAKLFQNKISVRPSQIHNYGVFADKNIKKGEVIEECCVLEAETDGSFLGDYQFQGKDKNNCFIVFGYGMLYNHSDRYNATYCLRDNSTILTFVANRFIRKDEEIYIYYGPTWFADRKITMKPSSPPPFSLINPLTISLTKMTMTCGFLYTGFLLLLHFYQPWRELLASFGVMMLVK